MTHICSTAFWVLYLRLHFYYIVFLQHMTRSEDKFHTYVQAKIRPQGSTPRGRVRVLGINPRPPTPTGSDPQGQAQNSIQIKLSSGFWPISLNIFPPPPRLIPGFNPGVNPGSTPEVNLGACKHPGWGGGWIWGSNLSQLINNRSGRQVKVENMLYSCVFTQI